MKISDTGNGLTIIIGCDYTVLHNWMSFICWYSLTKNLPDAKIIIACNKAYMKSILFRWTQKCQVPFILHKPTDKQGQIFISQATKPVLYIAADTICVRDFGEAGFSPNDLSEEKEYFLDKSLICDCKEERACLFVTYSNGWGRFVTSEWINRVSSPFSSSMVKFDRGDMTANELRISKLWQTATLLFQTVAKE